MSDHSAHDIQKSLRKYWFVFGVLMIGTVLTVWMYYIHLPKVWMTVSVALLIASVKAFFVAGFFMHLISEKKLIYAVLASTAFFFAGLMALTIWALQDYPMLSTFTTH